MNAISKHLRSLRTLLNPRDGDEPSWLRLWTLMYLAFLFMNWNDAHWSAWLPVTVLSVVVFLPLYFTAIRCEGRNVLYCAAGMALLGALLIPLNTGANTYLIYAGVLLPYSGIALRTSILIIMGGLALLAIELLLLVGWPVRYVAMEIGITAIVATAICAANHLQREKQLRQAELKLSHDEVRRLAGLAERERIGRDLHDLLGHTLSLITLKSELAVKLFDRDPVAARSEIVDVERVARDALGQVRRAVTGIRAAGLAAELASARLLLESSGVHLHYDVTSVSLPANIETVLALVVREAITNIHRHAHASRTEVRLDIVDQGARLRIDDNGNGRTITPGNGLTGMRERLRALGGDLAIVATRGKGTRLEARVSIPELANGNVVPLTTSSVFAQHG
ncbi:MAG: sensor histidine kinase [Dokdonella sp.]